MFEAPPERIAGGCSRPNRLDARRLACVTSRPAISANTFLLTDFAKPWLCCLDQGQQLFTEFSHFLASLIIRPSLGVIKIRIVRLHP